MDFFYLARKKVNRILTQLRKEGLLDEETASGLETAEMERLFSVFWQIKTILYLGVSLLAGGLGVLIYKNIDTIGHLTIVILIGLGSASCFTYTFMKSPPFSLKKVASPGMGFDYILLFGCLLFLIFLGYLQWQYMVFGTRFGLATAIPAFVLLGMAYRFDHLGVLTMGLTLFASWIGLTITPFEIFTANDFNSVRIIYTGLALAAIFGAASFLHRSKDFKKHFSFTYVNFAAHLGGFSCLSGLFTQPFLLLWMFFLALVVAGIYKYAISQRSFYFTLVSMAYGYIGAAFIFTTRVFKWIPEVLSVYLIFFFYIISCYFMLRLIKQIRFKTRKDDVV